MEHTELKIGLIVACSENGVIGVDGDLPWRLPDDLRHFMRSTKGHAVIMGRKTFESLKEPLPERLNIVVSSTMPIKDRDPEVGWGAWGVVVVRSVAEALELGRRADQTLSKGLIWVAGGGEIYRQTLAKADAIVRTLVHTVVEGDTRFPDLDAQAWTLERSEDHGADERHSCRFTVEWWARAV